MTLNVLIRVCYEGRSVHFPIDGLLLGQWDASSVDLLLGDGRLVLGVWGGQVPRGYSRDDRTSASLSLLSLLEVFRSSRHGRRVPLLPREYLSVVMSHMSRKHHLTPGLLLPGDLW